MITVFTSTYNRADLLPRLYESLSRQTFKDFEWVIVDDGSFDDTKKVIDNWMSCDRGWDNHFSIRYYYQDNGGKHRAINRGVKEANGELFYIADSDDVLPIEALETISMVYDNIKDDKSFAGVCGLDGDFDGKVIGSGLPKSVIDDNSINIRFKYRVTGDLKEVFRTDVLKRNPFPEFDGEHFCPEMLVWNRIATKYKLRFFNRIIYLVEYQADGITSSIIKARMCSPMASMMTYAELLGLNIPFIQKIKAAINYWRFSFCSKIAEKPQSDWRYYWTMPIGFLMHKRDQRTVK